MGFGASDRQSRKDIAKGREQALQQLSQIFQGPLEGLRLAPEFFRLAGSADLANTPVGKGLSLQNQILDQASAALNGQDFNGGRIPADLQSAILESTGGQQAARGTYGGGAANLALANRFAGASEDIRARRQQSALQALAGTGAAAGVLPGSEFFGQLGAQRSLAAANAIQSSFADEAKYAFQSEQSQQQAYGQLLGLGLGAVTGGLAGGLGGLGGLGISGGLGGAGQGALAFTGLAPYGAFGRPAGQDLSAQLLALLQSQPGRLGGLQSLADIFVP